MASFLISSVFTGSLSLLANAFFHSVPTNKSKSDTCATPTTFDLPNTRNTCPTTATTYQMVFFGPQGSLTSSNSGPMKNAQNVACTTTVSNYQLQLYKPLEASASNLDTLSNVTIYTDANKMPINMCPQVIQNADTSLTYTALMMPFPLSGNQSSGSHNGPGLENVCPTNSIVRIFGPLGTSNGSSSLDMGPFITEKPSQGTPGRITTLYIEALLDCVLYIELSGAYGGAITLNSGLIDSQGKPIPLDVGYTGGRPGVVFGKVIAKQNDILKVFLGSQGSNPATATTDLPLGQGGQATMYAGANGGGSSYIVHFQASQFAAKTDMVQQAQQNNNGKLLAVAGGGGGASVNASGGSAGFFADSATSTLSYGQAIQSQMYGSQGGLTNYVGDAPYIPGIYENEYSGGGGTSGTGGRSNVTSQFPPRGAFGTALNPFLTSGGGNATATDIGSGGGGGGSGYFGGGAGGYNNVVNPNNLHGAGGGGSSINHGLSPIMQSKGIGNVYRMGTPFTTRDGYLVVGLAIPN